jgi:hypothetical protein
MSEQFDAEGRLLQKPLESVKIFGTPGFVYRELLKTSGGWLKAIFQKDKSSAFAKENQVRHLISYIRTSHQYNLNKQSLVSEIGSLLKKVFRNSKSR